MRHHLILKVITKFMVGVIILFGLYVQFHGDYSPGGGFQAGVIIAAAFILYGIVMGLETVQKVGTSLVCTKRGSCWGFALCSNRCFLGYFWVRVFKLFCNKP